MRTPGVCCPSSTTCAGMPDRLGPDRWDAYPRTNKWTFIQHLWHLTKEAKKMEAPVADRVGYFIDQGKMVVGLAAEIFSLFEYEKLE